MKFEPGNLHDLVCCEVCGDPNGLHMRVVRVNELGNVTAITPARIEQYKTKKNAWARGSIVEIDFWCECGGHQFTAKFQFHKGQVLHTTETHPPLPSFPGDKYVLADDELRRD
jgi:hypothetical protein